jgi:DNA recombination protein RmuC
MQLRHAVELAGMLQHCDFETQSRFGSWEADQRPDMVFSLCGGRMIFVDAKTPLESCMAAASVSDETIRREKLDAFTPHIPQFD